MLKYDLQCVFSIKLNINKKMDCGCFDSILSPNVCLCLTTVMLFGNWKELFLLH